jgi:hypothetical protein
MSRQHLPFFFVTNQNRNIRGSCIKTDFHPNSFQESSAQILPKLVAEQLFEL